MYTRGYEYTRIEIWIVKFFEFWSVVFVVMYNYKTDHPAETVPNELVNPIELASVGSSTRGAESG